MSPRRLKAPDADGALLAEPPLSESGSVLARNFATYSSWNHDFQGRRASRLRAIARREVLSRARQYLDRAGIARPDLPDDPQRLIVTGHQPDLFHPGVWIKNFAAAGIAREHDGVGLNLIVDNDVPKGASIRVPHPDGDRLRVHRVEYADGAGEIPFEEWRVRDESLFASFTDRVHEVLGGAVTDPLLDDFWPRAQRLGERDRRIGYRFALARREIEAAWGIHNLEVPLSALCETEAFLWFTCHILAQLPRFQAVHNEALVRYRALYGIRSRHHPVPMLGRRGEWSEAPFWVWRAEEPRRRPLLVRQLARTMQLRIDGESEPLDELPLGPDREACCAVEQLLRLPARKIRLRTRALTTTMFARLLLGDLFLHGIGGAKYDELGDEIVRGFFGLEPPGYLTLSLTLWLGLETERASPERLHRLERALRDLRYNPDRSLPTPVPEEATPWVAAKQRAIGWPEDSHRQRVDRCLEIRRCNEALQPLVLEERERLVGERSSLRSAVQRDLLARSREYAFVLHSEHRLREVMAGAAGGLVRV